jgi:hypothetical protein
MTDYYYVEHKKKQSQLKYKICLKQFRFDEKLMQYNLFLYLSPRMQQPVRGRSAAMLAGNGSDMQGIHPVMYHL